MYLKFSTSTYASAHHNPSIFFSSFIIAADYWQSRFPGQSVALDMSMTYIIVALATVLLNNVFLTLAPFRVRVAFGRFCPCSLHGNTT